MAFFFVLDKLCISMKKMFDLNLDQTLLSNNFFDPDWIMTNSNVKNLGNRFEFKNHVLYLISPFIKRFQ